VDAWHANLDVVRDCDNTSNALRCAFGLIFVCVAANKSRQRDSATMRRYSNIGGIEIRVPPQFFLNVSFELAVGFHHDLRVDLSNNENESRELPSVSRRRSEAPFQIRAPTVAFVGRVANLGRPFDDAMMIVNFCRFSLRIENRN
jgi:hypothetical protein